MSENLSLEFKALVLKTVIGYSELLGFAEKLEVDCFGNILNACKGIGLGKFHSKELPVIVSLLNLETEVKNDGTAQGFSLTFLPLAKISKII